MRLTSLTIHRVGPFFASAQIKIDRNVTILTGPNDVGKSTVLSCVKQLLEQRKIEEDAVNHDHVQTSTEPWNADAQITIAGVFEFQNEREAYAGYQYTPGDTATVTLRPAPKVATTDFLLKTKFHGQRADTIKMPVVVQLRGSESVSEEIDLASPNQIERYLLDVGFGSEFSFAKIQAMKDTRFTTALLTAEDKLNQQLSKILPRASSLKFSLRPVIGDRKRLALMLRDPHEGITPFGLRGSGVRKMVTLFAEIMRTGAGSNRVILIDEPENSLHADAQHLLRELLYSVTLDDKTQVIYATHSPAMINPMRPDQLRLLKRDSYRETATSVVEKDSTNKNYLTVRTSLGISAVDSLLFAPVTVIVEGKSEIHCISKAFAKLDDSSTPGFTETKKLLSLSHFLDGEGDSFEYLVRLAESHGTKTIVFLDADKARHLEKQGFKEKHPNCPIILLPKNKEFEELIPTERYFAALAQHLNVADSASLMNEFSRWVVDHPEHEKRMFSKKVERWLDETRPDFCFRKAMVLKDAIDEVEPNAIDARPFKELLDAIRSHLNNTSFV